MAGKLSMVPEAQTWHEKVKEIEAARKELEEQQKQAVADKDAEVERWRMTVKSLQAMKDLAEQKEREQRDAEVEAMRKVHNVQWAAVQQATEYEDRIRALEKLVEEERLAHAQERDRQAELMKKVCDEANARVLEAEKRCVTLVAAADKRAREAVARMEEAKCQAAEEVELTRAREEDRVARVRHLADSHVRDFEERQHLELEQTHSSMIERQRAMEETLYTNGRQQSEGLHVARAWDKDTHELQLANATDAAIKDSRAIAQKSLLELEKTLHARTVERMSLRLADSSMREPVGLKSKAMQGLGASSTPRSRSTGHYTAGLGIACSPLARTGGVVAK